MVAKREHVEYMAMVAEIIGALAVVVSVAYLAIQISDNTLELKGRSHFSALSLAQRPLELLIPDRELSTIVNTGYLAPQDLSAADWQRFALYQVMAFNAWEYLYYANESNSVSGNLWSGADAYYRELVRSKAGLVRFWTEYAHIYDEPFRSYVDSAFSSSRLADVQAVDRACGLRVPPTFADKIDCQPALPRSIVNSGIGLH